MNALALRLVAFQGLIEMQKEGSLMFMKASCCPPHCSYELSEPSALPISALREHGLETLKQTVEEAIVKSTGKQVLALRVDLSSSQLR